MLTGVGVVSRRDHPSHICSWTAWYTMFHAFNNRAVSIRFIICIRL